jgi:hypothetical protein
MVDRLPAPGPSYLRLQPLRVAGAALFAGISRPSTPTEDWWATILWVEGEEGVVSFADLASTAGPPPGSPLERLGPAIAGGLSGLILEDAGRLQLRLGLVISPDDAERPWRCPAIVRAAFRWEPARAAAMRPNDVTSEVLTAFRRAAEGLGRRRVESRSEPSA